MDLLNLFFDLMIGAAISVAFSVYLLIKGN